MSDKRVQVTIRWHALIPIIFGAYFVKKGLKKVVKRG